MLSQLDDFWLGAIILAIFVPLCIAAGYLIVRFQNWRLSFHWRPLLPLFTDVSLASAVGSGAGGILHGMHRGRRFKAWIGGDSADLDGDDRFNVFTLELLDVPGDHDWCVVQRPGGLLGLGKAQWHVESGSPALADALRAAGVMEAAFALGGEDYTVAQTGPVLAYKRSSMQPSSGRLVLRRDTRKARVPAPDTLRDDMAALLHWAEVNARLNPPPARSLADDIATRSAQARRSGCGLG
jgi:hypothetical protein